MFSLGDVRRASPPRKAHVFPGGLRELELKRLSMSVDKAAERNRRPPLPPLFLKLGCRLLMSETLLMKAEKGQWVFLRLGYRTTLLCESPRLLTNFWN